MSDVAIAWAPRIILTGRVFRLPVRASEDGVVLSADGFDILGQRWVPRDSAWYYYVRAPRRPGDYSIGVRAGAADARVDIQVRSLEELRRPFVYNGVQWPRRRPVGETLSSSKTRRTMQSSVHRPVDRSLCEWWLKQPDDIIWKQLPNAEMPRAHFVNVHQGSPTSGTAVFRHSGYYPWRRNHLPCDYKSICPETGHVFPSNNPAEGDFVSGDYPDDGYGYVDGEGNLFLFVATYTRDQVRTFGSAVAALTELVRQEWDDEAARTLALMLLRYAQEECYVAAAPQFRYGPSRPAETQWTWGQPDWGAAADPIGALHRIGSLRYSIDTPWVAETMALAYDTIWPLLRTDQDVVRRGRAQGLELATPNEAVELIEEMLACLLQCVLDRAAGSNRPNESRGAFAVIRALDRDDAREVVDWLYDEGPDRLRVFITNNFFTDGTPPEATGGYNSIHTNGIYELEEQLRELRSLHPHAYPESRYPSLLGDPRASRIAQAPHEITMCGRTWFQFGDGTAPGTSSQFLRQLADEATIEMAPDCFHAPMNENTLDRAAAFTDDPAVRDLRDSVKAGTHRRLGTTLLDGVGLAVLRTGGVPECAAAGVAYGDAVGHRHRDLLDVQLVAFGRPYLTDLGYPQSWASAAIWEDHWATHNTVWGSTDGGGDARSAGRGRVVRVLRADGVQILDVAADRWEQSADGMWTPAGVSFRRLIALVETDGAGVALVDLSRIRGGTMHWRTCRGLEGDFRSACLRLMPRAGTVAGTEVGRGQLRALRDPGESALAYMDEVTTATVGNRTWSGSWQSRTEPSAHLDVHQAHASEGVELITARATATMGTPEESRYQFRTLLWKREPRAEHDRTSDGTIVDLVFEPHVGVPTLDQVSWNGDGTAADVLLKTRAGREIRILWVPEGSAQFADGFRMDEGVGVIEERNATIVSASHFGGGQRDAARVRRTVLGLDRDACTVDVQDLYEIEPGCLVVVNPARGHVYTVTAVDGAGHGRSRLTLNVSSVVGRAQVERVEGDRVVLRHHVIARTGNLSGSRLERETGNRCGTIAYACNPDRRSTELLVEWEREARPAPGEWVRVVDYAVGDDLTFEPQRSWSI